MVEESSMLVNRSIVLYNGSMTANRILLIIFLLELLFILSLLRSFTFFHSVNQKQTDTPAADAIRMAQTCKSSNLDWRNCYTREFTNLTRLKPFDYSLKTLSDLEKIDAKTNDCHLLGHAIATGEMAKNPNWQDFIKKIDANYCTGGFIHGVIEGLYRDDPDFKLNAQTLSQMCNVIKDSVKGSGGEQYCAHIMGHLLLTENVGNIPDSVKICSNIPTNMQYQCYGGIFMENITRDNLVLHIQAKHIPINEDSTGNQEKLCKEYEGLAATGCWRELSHMYIILAHNDPFTTYNYCNRASIKTNKDECFLHGAGLIIRDPQLKPNTLAVCDPLVKDTKLFHRCVQEMVHTLLAASTQYAPRAKAFCERISDTNERASCFTVQNQKVTVAPRDD